MCIEADCLNGELVEAEEVPWGYLRNPKSAQTTARKTDKGKKKNLAAVRCPSAAFGCYVQASPAAQPTNSSSGLQQLMG
eukprot:m.153686 g.153686  ORF g.153686 m.153686 type:complete len:79 (+) comp10175_c0_seq6:1163-1399(+)